MSFSNFIYFIGGLLVYCIATAVLYFNFQASINDFLFPFLIIGVGFSIVSWLLTKKYTEALHRHLFKNEIWILLLLITLIIFYITIGGNSINKLLLDPWIENPAVYSVIIFLRKLLFFVLVPFGIYKIFGFSLKDFGLKESPVKFFSKNSFLLLVVFSISILLFQYYLGNGAKDIKTGTFNSVQLIIGLPLCLIYLIFDAGLIEEFFFRGLLQSRISVLLRSSTGGIVVSAIIFGLVHAPGLYLRGAGSEGIEEQMPFIFFAAYTIVYMSIAGLFLGILYSKTKCLWLVIVIHAMVDLLPNFGDFINTWGIK